MEDKFFDKARESGLFSPGDRILVAFSGGADSAALLHLLVKTAAKLEITLAACHVHHGIRGEEAKRDARFAAGVCDKLRVPFYLRRVDVPAYAAKCGRGIEESARILRYQSLEEVAALDQADKIATAHTQNDQVETMLFHLIRGSGLAGLSGMAPVRGRLVRPLLWCTRAEIEAYCREERIAYIEDSTNADIRYSRNRIRQRIVPAMTQINPAFVQNAARLMALASEENAYLERLAAAQCDSLICRNKAEGMDGAAGYDVGGLRALDPVLRRRVLIQLVRKHTGLTADRAMIERCERLVAVGQTSSRSDLAGGYEGYLAYGRLYFRLKPTPAAPAAGPLHGPIPLHMGDNALWHGKKVRLHLINRQEYEKIHRKFIKNVLSYDKIKGILSARSRVSGDVAAFFTRRGRKKLKKWLIDEKIPQSCRDDLAILCDEDGIVWVEGFGSVLRAAPTGSGQLIWIEIEGDGQHASGRGEDFTQ